jgi:uncharacterized protein
MDARAAELIRLLRLERHPEGGWYREVHRSVLEADGGKSAVTSIYFLLAAGERSRLHRVLGADEIWLHHEGAPLELFCASNERGLERFVLGPAATGSAPQAVIPAGCWQAARPLGAYTLVGCAVAPGFEFSRFAMLSDLPEEAAAFRARFPELAPLI